MLAMALTERYATNLHGVLSRYDRTIVTGTLPGACDAGGMANFLYLRGIRISDNTAVPSQAPGQGLGGILPMAPVTPVVRGAWRVCRHALVGAVRHAHGPAMSRCKLQGAAGFGPERPLAAPGRKQANTCNPLQATPMNMESSR